MALIPINNVGQYGIIKDVRPYQLPLNAWSDGQNVRVKDGHIEKMLGHSQVFGTPTVAPYYTLPVLLSGTTYAWLYAGLAKVYAYDGVTHTNITRAAGDYSATAMKNWTGVNFGGIPVINNSVDVPQAWTTVAVASPLVNLPNWNAAWTCGSMRGFKQFLVAMNLIKSGTSYPQMVKWSHGAAAGAVPASWDETNPAVDAGEYTLSTSEGQCIDGVPMRDTFVIYKEDEVHGMQYVGGEKVMRFYRMFGGWGILARRCAAEFFTGKHAVFGFNDLYVHDGQSIESVVDEKLRRWLFTQIDSTYYRTCFVAVNFPFSEVWFCYPTNGNSVPNQAIVWNWKTGTTGVRDLPGVSHIRPGIIDPSASDAWDVAVGDWNSDSTSWDETAYNPTKSKLLMSYPAGPKLYMADDTNQIDGSDMTSMIERIGLGLPFDVGAPPDIESMKMVTGIYPRIYGDNGNTVSVSIGTQMNPEGAVTYQAAQNYTIGTTLFLPCLATGRLHSIKFQSTGNFSWRLDGYDLEVKRVGRF